MIKKEVNVCVIDDDMIYQFLAREVIEYTNMANKIMFFSNGEKALQFIVNTIDNNDLDALPDIIFLDINMPVMDGWEFLDAYAQIKPKIGKKIVIYMVSSSTDIRDLDRAKAITEVSDYIIKPVSSKQLESIFIGLLP
jgi:CheY-like chemotaxis protein